MNVATKAATGHDVQTRARLLNAAARLFAGRGFKNVTVREICGAANANVAAVNYHFSDKMGLYREVLGKAIRTMTATTEAARQAGAGRSAQDKLRVYIRVFLERVSGARQDAWIHQLMAHELAEPTPALELVVEQVILPRLAYVGEIVSELIGRPPDDPAVLRSVLSIQAQCHTAMKHSLAARLWPDFPFDRGGIEALASHIAEFSLAGIREVAKRCDRQC